MSELEGVIKYTIEFVDVDLPLNLDITDVNELRDFLYDKNLVGVYENGLGFGNVSTRVANGFVITGSATGTISTLDRQHYALVDDFSIEGNWVHSVGRTKASSESLAHGMIYNLDSSITFVAHIHSKELWNKYKFVLPTTNPAYEYGTPQLAQDIQRVCTKTTLLKGTLIMGGHEDGLILFAKTKGDIIDQVQALQQN